MRRLTVLSFLFAIATAASPAAASNISMSHVVLRGLDKLTGRISTMTVAVGQKAQFGILDVYVRVCYTHPPEEIPENAAFLEIVEKKNRTEQKVFSGWMFSSSPALSAMEHPVYDIWVLKCQGQPKAAPTPAPLVLKTALSPEEKPAEKPADDTENTPPEEPENPDEPSLDDISDDDIADIEDSVVIREETAEDAPLVETTPEDLAIETTDDAED